jgi:hypothetical protein
MAALLRRAPSCWASQATFSASASTTAGPPLLNPHLNPSISRRVQFPHSLNYVVLGQAEANVLDQDARLAISRLDPVIPDPHAADLAGAWHWSWLARRVCSGDVSEDLPAMSVPFLDRSSPRFSVRTGLASSLPAAPRIVQDQALERLRGQFGVPRRAQPGWWFAFRFDASAACMPGLTRGAESSVHPVVPPPP